MTISTNHANTVFQNHEGKSGVFTFPAIVARAIFATDHRPPFEKVDRSLSRSEASLFGLFGRFSPSEPDDSRRSAELVESHKKSPVKAA